MNPPASMIRTLVLWLTGAMVVFWLATALAAYLIMRDESGEMFDSALEETTRRLMPLVVDDLFQRESGDDAMRLPDGGAETQYLIYQVRDADGRVLLHSHEASRLPFAVPLQNGFSDTPTHRVFTLAAVSGTVFLQVADPFDHREEATGEAGLSLILPLLGLAPASMLAIWLIVRRSLAPVALLQREIGMRDGGNLERLGTGALPAELAAIAASVDRLLERLREALDAEREFTANSAHELRTPIAGALVQTQRLIIELPNGKLKERTRQIEASLAGLSHLAEKMLQMARAESGIGLSAQAVDLVPVVRLVLRDFEGRREHAARLTARIGEGASLTRRVDVDAFAIALRNLVENALLHGAADEPVVVAVDSSGLLTVVNGGAVIPPDIAAQLGTRFRRGETGAAGSGLGLAIARRLILAMGGTIDLVSPASDRADGVEVRVLLPAREAT